jgi:hypothetical protein
MIRWFPMPAEVVQAHLATTGAYAAPASEMMAMLEYGFIATSGQMSFWTERRLAERWGWSKSRVHRLTLNYADLVEKRVDQEWTKKGPEKDQERTKTEPEADQERTKQISSGAASGVFSGPKAVKNEPEPNQERTKNEPEKSLARALGSYTLTDATNHSTERVQRHQEHPPTPQGGTAVAAAKPAQLAIVPTSSPAPSKRKGSPNAEAGVSLPSVLSSLDGRSDAGMWATLWTKLHVANKPFVLEIVQVWDAYRAVFPERRVLDDDGANKIGEALRLGYSVQDLCKVPAGARLSPFHMGENDKGKRYIDPVSLYREAKTIDAHIERLNPPKTVTKSSTRNIYGGQQEGIDWDAELRGGR